MKDDINKCKKCNCDNDLLETKTDNCGIYESKTICNICLFEDYWAYGYFMSSSTKITYIQKILKRIKNYFNM